MAAAVCSNNWSIQKTGGEEVNAQVETGQTELPP